MDRISVVKLSDMKMVIKKSKTFKDFLAEDKRQIDHKYFDDLKLNQNLTKVRKGDLCLK